MANQMVEITMDGFLDTLNQLRGHFEYGASVWDLFISMVVNDQLDLSGGPSDVLYGFKRDAEILDRKDFERKYPKYSKIMTWEEFIENECICGNDEAAVVRIQ